MNTPRILKLLFALCSAFVTTALFGQQTNYIWTGAANGTNLSTAANWTTNGVDPATTLPNGNNGLGDGFQDSAQWDGKTTTNLLLIYNTTWPATGFGSVGVNLVLTANQLNDVQITTTLATSAGLGVNYVTNNSPSAAFTMGDDTANNWLVFGRPAGAIHYYVNNSTAPATIKPSVKFQAGGGNGYTYQFGGSGNWVVNSFLMPDNNAFSASPITVDGPGTVFWYGGKAGGYNPNSPLGQITLNGGRLVIKNAGLFTGTANQAIVNEATFIFDAAAQAQSLSGIISGAGLLQVTNGTLTLSGQSTYSGTTLLSGGTLIVNGSETDLISGPLGFGGPISFAGGTLQFSVNNVYDYSGRFSTAAGQAYSIDTGGQNVTFTNNLASSGATFTKLGNGTLTLAGTSSYSGLTTVSGGRLLFQGSKTGAGSITVADGATLAVTATGTQVTPATLTVGSSSALGFNNVNSTTTALLAAGTISAASPITLNVNSGTFTPGNSYPLLAWTGGSAPAVSLGVLNGFIGNLTTNGGTIQLNITATAYRWTGVTDGNWDLTTGNNWVQNGGPVIFANGGPVLFDDTSTRTNVTINAPVQPTTVTVNPATNPYTITSNGGNNLGGSASLTKSGDGSLALAGGANTYTGATTVNDGTLSVGVLANGGVASDLGQSGSGAGNLVLDGGALQYTGGGNSSDRLFTLGTSGGTIDASGTGDLNLNNSGALGYSGNGPRTLTLAGTGPSNTLAAVLANNGGATALIKNGAGLWVLTGNNTHSGVNTINGGVLQIGNGGGSGALGSGNTVNDGSLIFNRTGSLTVGGAVGGAGSVIVQNGTVILAGNNTYAGGTTISNASTLQIGNGGGTGALNANGATANEGTLIFNFTVQPPDIFGIISGTGQLIKRGSGVLRIFGANTYTGNTTIEAGTLQPCTGNVGSLASPQIAVSNNATLLLVRQDTAVFIYAGNIVGAGRVVKDVNNVNVGDVTFTGTNTYTGGTFIAGGGIVLGDNGITPYGGSIVGSVAFTNSTVDNNVTRTLTLNYAQDAIFTNNIIGATTGANAGTRGAVAHNGSGKLTLTGNNTYPDGTTIAAGTLQVGNGGTSGSIGNGNVTANGPLVFNRSDSLTFGGNLSGSAQVSQSGAGTVTLTSTNYSGYFGILTVSNGTLAISGFTAPNTTNVLFSGLDVSGGTLVVGGVGSVSSLEVPGPMNINSGTVVASLNTSLSPSNTFYSASVAVISGTLKLINAGPKLVVGQKFTLFSQPVNGLTIVSPGFTVQNDLATDGSVTVTAVQPAPTITATVTGNQMNLSWPASWTGGVHVQGQTNTLAKGISTNWVTIPGTDASNTYSTMINQTNGAVFYRLIAP